MKGCFFHHISSSRECLVQYLSDMIEICLDTVSVAFSDTDIVIVLVEQLVSLTLMAEVNDTLALTLGIFFMRKS